MYGIHSYEEMLRDPYLDIIDWAYITLHPEAKFAIRERYYMDSVFRMRIEEKKNISPLFKRKFEEYFPELIKSR